MALIFFYTSRPPQQAFGRLRPRGCLLIPPFGDLFQSTFHLIPVCVLEEGGYVVSALQPVIGHEGMLEDVHYQEGNTTCWLAGLMLINPLVKEFPGDIVLI